MMIMDIVNATVVTVAATTISPNQFYLIGDIIKVAAETITLILVTNYMIRRARVKLWCSRKSGSISSDMAALRAGGIESIQGRIASIVLKGPNYVFENYKKSSKQDVAIFVVILVSFLVQFVFDIGLYPDIIVQTKSMMIPTSNFSNHCFVGTFGCYDNTFTTSVMNDKVIQVRSNPGEHLNIPELNKITSKVVDKKFDMDKFVKYGTFERVLTVQQDADSNSLMAFSGNSACKDSDGSVETDGLCDTMAKNIVVKNPAVIVDGWFKWVGVGKCVTFRDISTPECEEAQELMQNVDLAMLSAPVNRTEFNKDCHGVSYGVLDMFINERQWQSNISDSLTASFKENKKMAGKVRNSQANTFGKPIPVYYRNIAFSGEVQRDVPFFNWRIPMVGFVNGDAGLGNIGHLFELWFVGGVEGALYPWRDLAVNVTKNPQNLIRTLAVCKDGILLQNIKPESSGCMIYSGFEVIEFREGAEIPTIDWVEMIPKNMDTVFHLDYTSPTFPLSMTMALQGIGSVAVCDAGHTTEIVDVFSLGTELKLGWFLAIFLWTIIFIALVCNYVLTKENLYTPPATIQGWYALGWMDCSSDAELSLKSSHVRKDSKEEPVTFKELYFQIKNDKAFSNNALDRCGSTWLEDRKFKIGKRGLMHGSFNDHIDDDSDNVHSSYDLPQKCDNRPV